MQILEPQLGVLGLVLGGLHEDVGDLDVAVLLGLRRVVTILGVRLRLTGERGLEVLLSLRVLEIHWTLSPPAGISSRCSRTHGAPMLRLYPRRQIILLLNRN